MSIKKVQKTEVVEEDLEKTLMNDVTATDLKPREIWVADLNHLNNINAVNLIVNNIKYQNKMVSIQTTRTVMTIYLNHMNLNDLYIKSLWYT